MKRSLIFAVIGLFCAVTMSVFAAGGGADYGRGPETDPVASALVTGLTTNLNASNLASGTVPNARLDSDLQALAINNGSGVTNLNASNLGSGTVPNARLDSELQDLADDNGASVTNLNASNLASGTVPNTTLDSDLQALAVNNGSGVTNLNASNLASGTVPNATLDSELQDLAEDNGASVTNLNASGIASGTLAAERLPATAVVTDSTNLLTQGFFDVVDTTQLVFIAGSVTNVIDASIVTP